MTEGVLVSKFLSEKLNHKQNKNLMLSKAFLDVSPLVKLVTK